MTEIVSHARGGSRIRVNGVSLHCEERGAGDPIVCIHGSGSSAALWADAIDELAAHGRAIAYDRRGSGRSERPDPYTTDVHEQADDAAALIDALGAAPAIVIGRSYGGEIAVDLALRHPDRVRALALLEGGGLSLSDAAARWLAELDEQVYAAAETDIRTVGKTMISLVAGDATWEAMPDAAKRLFTANGPAIVAEHRGGLLDVGPQQLASIRRPTLIVGAQHSPPAFAETTNLLASAMPSARVEWVPGGHLIDPAHPAVLAFVDEVCGRA